MRAEFIRIQLQIEDLRSSAKDWPILARKEAQLLKEYRTFWEKPFRDLILPKLSTPGRWLKAKLFYPGGQWYFRRGFIEEIDAEAYHFLREDVMLIGHAPIRQVVVSRASRALPGLAEEPRLDRIRRLYLIADAELDNDMEELRQSAIEMGMSVLELRLPRVGPDAAGLLSMFCSPDSASSVNESKYERIEEVPLWLRAGDEARLRIRDLADRPWVVQQYGHPGGSSHAERLRLNEWIFLGDLVAKSGAWATAKTYHDLEENGLCRRLVIFKPGKAFQPATDELRESAYFFQEWHPS